MTNKHTQQITVLELILETLDTQTNQLTNKIQEIENTIYYIQHTTKTPPKHTITTPPTTNHK